MDIFNGLRFITLFSLVIIPTIQGSSIKQKIVDGKIIRICNRNMADTMNPSGLYFPHFKIQSPTRKILHHCPKVKASCCTDNEIETYVNNWKKNQTFVKYLKIQLLELFEYLDVISPNDLESKDSDKFKCDYTKIKDFAGLKRDLKSNKQEVIRILDKYLEYYNNYFIGAACTVCNADLNRFLSTIRLENDNNHYLRIDISKKSCSRAFKMIKDTFPLVDFLFKYLNLVNRIVCINNYDVDILNYYNNEFKIKREEDMNFCANLKEKDILNSAECKNICIIMHNPVYLFDVFNMILLLDANHLVMNGKYGDLRQLDEEFAYVTEVDEFLNFYKLSPNPYYQDLDNNLKGQILDEGIDYIAQEGKGITILRIFILSVSYFFFLFKE